MVYFRSVAVLLLPLPRQSNAGKVAREPYYYDAQAYNLKAQSGLQLFFKISLQTEILFS